MLGSIWRIWSFTSGVRQIRVRTSNMLGKFGKFRGEVDGIFAHHSIELPVNLNILKYYNDIWICLSRIIDDVIVDVSG